MQQDCKQRRTRDGCWSLQALPWCSSDIDFSWFTPDSYWFTWDKNIPLFDLAPHNICSEVHNKQISFLHSCHQAPILLPPPTPPKQFLPNLQFLSWRRNKLIIFVFLKTGIDLTLPRVPWTAMTYSTTRRARPGLSTTLQEKILLQICRKVPIMSYGLNCKTDYWHSFRERIILPHYIKSVLKAISHGWNAA